MTAIAFIDESGDRGLENIDPESPVFVLAAALYQLPDYIQNDVVDLARLKIARWGHEGVVLRSYDIRKKLGPFAFCKNTNDARAFHKEIADLFARSKAKVIAAAIDKQRHNNQYVWPEDPYFLSVKFVLERIKMATAGRARIVFEARGDLEDAAVAGWCDRICGGENFRGERFPFDVCFAKKKHNVTGLQIADLAAYPISHYVRDKTTKRPDWLAVKPRIRSGWTGKIEGYGLKIFPEG